MSVLYSQNQIKSMKNEIISGKVRERVALDYDLITSDRLVF